MGSHSSTFPSQTIRRAIWLGLGILLVLIIGLLDFLTSSEIVLSLFYLIPIVIVAWNVHEGTGLGLALLSGGIVAYDGEIRSGYFISNPAIALLAMITRVTFFLVTAILVGRLRVTLRHSEQLAMTDDLTGAYNVRAFFDLLNKELLRNRRYGRHLTLFYLDLDNFKLVNDTLGHQAGNLVLQTVVSVMKSSVRLVDSVSRLGGDEFAVLLPETDENAAREVLPRMRENLLQEMQKNNWPVTFSIGALTCHESACTGDDAFRIADTLMYQVKHEGKNGIRYEVLKD